MKPLDSFKSGVAGIAEKFSGKDSMLLKEVTMLVQNMPGGIAAVTKKFLDHGTSQSLGSSTSQTATAVISPEQVIQVFGNEKINALALATGFDAKVVPQKVANILPSLIEQLSVTAKPAGVR